MTIQANKKLGQHFLKNKAKLRKIVDALELKDGDVVIEIGPGRGALTEEIVNKFISLKVNRFKLIAIEKDGNLAENLRNSMEIHGDSVEIIEGDALKILPQLTYKLTNLKTYKLVGNIPYYITGYLFRILGELEARPELIVLLIQKEVAERVCAKSSRFRQARLPDGQGFGGQTKMNLLAASVQFWAEPKIIGYVSRKDFFPPPKVESAIIKLTTYNQQPITNNLQSITQADKYYKFIKILFKQPRKTILNNLQPITRNLQLTTNDKQLLTEKLLKFDIKPTARPQDLSIEQIIELSTLI